MRRWILVSVVLLAGCAAPARDPGAQPSTPPPSTVVPAAPAPHTSWDVSALPDPCRTITNTEVAAALGGTVTAGVALDSWPPLCQFVLDPARRLFLYVSDDAGPTGREDYDRRRPTSDAQAVDGIGDEAYWQPAIASLHVLGGATHVFVAFGGVPAPDGARDKAIALARLILPRTASTHATPTAS